MLHSVSFQNCAKLMLGYMVAIVYKVVISNPQLVGQLL